MTDLGPKKIVAVGIGYLGLSKVLSDAFELVSAWTMTLSLCHAKTAPLSKSGGTVEFEILSS